MAWLKVRKQVEENKILQRDTVLQDLETGFSLYTEIAKGWLFKSIK
jgi:hypothetical protein